MLNEQVNPTRFLEAGLMQDTKQRCEQASVLSRGSIRHHSGDKLGHPRCTFALLCFQRCAMRVCRMVTFITHPLSGHLFNAGLQMSGSIPAFTGQRAPTPDLHRTDVHWLICSKQPTQKACKHKITQTQTHMYWYWCLSHQDSMKHSSIDGHQFCAHMSVRKRTQFATGFKSCFATAPPRNPKKAPVPQ